MVPCEWEAVRGGGVPETAGFRGWGRAASRNPGCSPAAGDGRPKNGDVPRAGGCGVRESGVFPAAAAARGGNPADSGTAGGEDRRFSDKIFSPGEKPGDSGTALAHPRGNPPIPGRLEAPAGLQAVVLLAGLPGKTGFCDSTPFFGVRDGHFCHDRLVLGNKFYARTARRTIFSPICRRRAGFAINLATNSAPTSNLLPKTTGNAPEAVSPPHRTAPLCRAATAGAGRGRGSRAGRRSRRDGAPSPRSHGA